MKAIERKKMNWLRRLVMGALPFCLFIFFPLRVCAANPYDNPDTIVVARDGTGQFRNITEAIEVCRAFMDYHKVI